MQSPTAAFRGRGPVLCDLTLSSLLLMPVSPLVSRRNSAERGAERYTGLSADERAIPCDRLAEWGTVLTLQPHQRRGASIRDEPIRVLIVDDRAMVRDALRVLLGNATDVVVVGEAEDGIAAVAAARRLAPDIVLLDLDMPGGNGASALGDLVALPNVRVLILTVHPEDGRLVPLLEAGARGYLTKEAAARDLVHAIRVVAADEVYVRPEAARMLAAARCPGRRGETNSASHRFNRLSDREQTVLRMVAEGYTGVEVARTLGISTKTVDTYKRRVEDKLGLGHRSQYVQFAIEAGVLDRPAAL